MVATTARISMLVIEGGPRGDGFSGHDDTPVAPPPGGSRETPTAATPFCPGRAPPPPPPAPECRPRPPGPIRSARGDGGGDDRARGTIPTGPSGSRGRSPRWVGPRG